MANQMSTLFFFNGTSFPMIGNNENDGYDMGRKQLMYGVKAGYSLPNQAEFIIKQLKHIEGLLFKHANPSTEKGMNTISKLLNTSLENLYSLWTMNVCSLLILKKIKNDNDNGVLTILQNRSVKKKEVDF